MKAALFRRYGPPDVVEVHDVERPEPGPGEVRVRVAAAALNPVDCKIRAGHLRLLVRRSLPLVTGLDLSGVVDAVGAGVTRLRPGEPVWGSTTPGHGTCAEYAVVPAAHLARKPPNLDHTEAAALAMVGLTALQALRHRPPPRGSRILVLGGSGGVGSAAIQLARSEGFRVSATCSSRNADWVRSLGAHQVVDYRTRDPARDLPPHDRVLDAVGDPVLARRCVRRGGTVLAIVGGVASAAQRWGPVVGTPLAFGALALHGVAARVRRVRIVHLLRRPGFDDLDALGARVEAGHLRGCVERVYSLDDVALAHAHVEAGRTRGKVVVSVG